MLTYTVDFLARSIIDGSHGIMTGINGNSNSDSQTVSSPNRMARSTGSPDSLRSESGSETSLSTSNMIQILDKKATIVTDGQNEDKPKHSYISLISMAILSTRENRMVLGDIYQFIIDKFPYYKNEDKAWKNSIRHNLSINECFIKNGRSENGCGNFWSIHPACVEDFSKGDFRRRQARRRARKGSKNTSMSFGTVNNFHCSPVYTPMTSSPIQYQPMASPSMGYQPMTSPSFGHQQMTSTGVPFLPFIPGYQSTPTISHDYLSYHRPMNSKSSDAQTTHADNNTSSAISYNILPVPMSPVERLSFTLPQLNTNEDIYSDMHLHL